MDAHICSGWRVGCVREGCVRGVGRGHVSRHKIGHSMACYSSPGGQDTKDQDHNGRAHLWWVHVCVCGGWG